MHVQRAELFKRHNTHIYLWRRHLWPGAWKVWQVMEEGLQCVKHKDKLSFSQLCPLSRRWKKKVLCTHRCSWCCARQAEAQDGQFHFGRCLNESCRQSFTIRVMTQQLAEKSKTTRAAPLQVLTFCDENTSGVDDVRGCRRRCQTFVPPTAAHRSIYRAAGRLGANQVRWEWCSAMSRYGTGV